MKPSVYTLNDYSLIFEVTNCLGGSPKELLTAKFVKSIDNHYTVEYDKQISDSSLRIIPEGLYRTLIYTEQDSSNYIKIYGIVPAVLSFVAGHGITSYSTQALSNDSIPVIIVQTSSGVTGLVSVISRDIVNAALRKMEDKLDKVCDELTAQGMDAKITEIDDQIHFSLGGVLLAILKDKLKHYSIAQVTLEELKPFLVSTTEPYPQSYFDLVNNVSRCLQKPPPGLVELLADRLATLYAHTFKDFAHTLYSVVDITLQDFSRVPGFVPRKDQRNIVLRSMVNRFAVENSLEFLYFDYKFCKLLPFYSINPKP